MCGPVLPAGGEGYGQGCGVCGFVFPDSLLTGNSRADCGILVRYLRYGCRNFLDEQSDSGIFLNVVSPGSCDMDLDIMIQFFAGACFA